MARLFDHLAKPLGNCSDSAMNLLLSAITLAVFEVFTTGCVVAAPVGEKFERAPIPDFLTPPVITDEMRRSTAQLIMAPPPQSDRVSCDTFPAEALRAVPEPFGQYLDLVCTKTNQFLVPKEGWGLLIYDTPFHVIPAGTPISTMFKAHFQNQGLHALGDSPENDGTRDYFTRPRVFHLSIETVDRLREEGSYRTMFLELSGFDDPSHPMVELILSTARTEPVDIMLAVDGKGNIDYNSNNGVISGRYFGPIVSGYPLSIFNIKVMNDALQKENNAEKKRFENLKQNPAQNDQGPSK
jgi:hypothetical protein